MSKSHYDHYAISLALFSLIGLWNIRENKLEWHGPKIFVNIFFHVLFIFFQISKFTSVDTVERALTLLKVLIPSLCNMFMYVTMLIKYNDTLKLWEHFEKDWDISKDTEDHAILVRYAKRSKSYTVIITFSSYGFYVLFILWPLLRFILGHIGIMRNTVEASFVMEYFLDARKYVKYYSLVLLFVNATALILITGGVATYTLFMSTVQHACAMFRVIGHKIRKVFQETQFTKCSVHGTDDEAYDLIITSIIYYRRVVEFIRLLNTCCEMNYLAQMTLAVIITGAHFIWMFQLNLSVTMNYEELLMSFIYIPGSLFIIYINCYIGQELSDHSTEFFQDVCKIPFYMGSLRTQKLVLWLMTRSIKPCTMSIGKLFTSSHAFFSGLLHNAFTISTLFFSLK